MTKYLLALLLSLCAVSVRAEVVEFSPTIAQAETILQSVQLKEPWHKPISGFGIGEKINKVATSGPAITVAAASAGALGVGLSLAAYTAVKHNETLKFFEAIGNTLATAASGTWSVVSCPEFGLSAGVLASVWATIKTSRWVYKKSSRGSCLVLYKKVEGLIKELKALDACYNLSFTSGAEAENSAKKMYATSAWPLIDLQKMLGNYFAELNLYYQELVSLEKKVKGTKIANDCALIKDATLCLVLCLSGIMQGVNSAPSMKEQEARYTDYLKQDNEHKNRIKESYLSAPVITPVIDIFV